MGMVVAGTEQFCLPYCLCLRPSITAHRTQTMKAMKGIFLALTAVVCVLAKPPSTNVPCKSMQEYLPPSVGATYDMQKHNGTWHEVAFRDLYPWGPLCDCQREALHVRSVP